MKIEENSNDKKVDELAGVLADGVTENTEKEAVKDAVDLEEQMKAELEDETSVSEESEENLQAVEETQEESVAEETSEEETSVPEEISATEETSESEETQVEETQTEESPKKKSCWKIIAIVAAVLVVIVAGVYVGMSMHYSECFMLGTEINGIDCSGMSVESVEKMLQKQVEDYTLVIEGANGYTEEIKGKEISIVYNGQGQLEKKFKKQNPFTWPKGLFKKSEISAELKFEFDSEKLNEKIVALGCLKPENQVAAVAATVVYKEGAFVIQEETYGTQVDTVKFTELVNTSVSEFVSSLNLEESGCYLQPRFTKDSPEVLAAKDEMNKYLTANITYSYDDIVVSLDKNQTYQWISVDENMTPVISVDGVKSFANTLSAKYNTANRGGQLTTPRGKVVNMPLGGYGRVVGVDSETNQLINEIKEGKTITREPILSRKATPEGQNIWGSTYVEVDITEQHVWFIVNGQVSLETDVITGTRGVHDTPTGVFQILEKQKNRVLRGRPGPDGKPSYLQPVDYWMRVTWSGIGLHDAGYRPTFLQHEYLTHGSHGCINMPPAKAAELYSILPMGTPVVIHY